MFIVRLSNTWVEIREADTRLKQISTHMLVKTTKQQRRYEVVGWDSYGDPIKKLAKEPKIVNTNIKVQQRNVVGGRVIAILSIRELMYNPWGLSVGYLDVGNFVEVHKNFHPYLRESKLMAQLFPSYMAVEDSA
jgi:hypothetical protein